MKPKVGISLCLLGQEVRHDGGHKRDRLATDVLTEYFDWVPMCPEMDIGMGVPREPVRLVDRDGITRLVGTNSGHDWTSEMADYAKQRAGELTGRIDGFILKKNSPSCGMERVKRYNEGGMPRRDGIGAFARVLMERLPNLPVEEEGRLQDSELRENFIARVFEYHRWRCRP